MSKAEDTRKHILEVAFQQIYEQGFQASSIDRIVEQTALTKGALFYHFANKETLGLAVIKEVIHPRFRDRLIRPMAAAKDPIVGIYTTIADFMSSVDYKQVIYGCPTNNLIQEMAPLNNTYREALLAILTEWEMQIAACYLRSAQQITQMEAQHRARFIIAGYEGTRGLGKLYRSATYYQIYLAQLKSYLQLS